MKKALKLSAVIVVCLVIGYITGAIVSTTQATQKTAATPPNRAELLSLVNQERAKYGAKPLVENALLDQSAQWKADDEVANNYFGHVKPGTKGNDGLDYLASLHPTCKYASENLVATNTSTSAVNWWEHSKSHFEAMVNPKYTLTGFGVSYAKYIPESHDGVLVEDKADIVNTYVIVEHFCQQP